MSLIETTIAVAIVAMAAGAALDTSILGARAAGAHAVRGVLQDAVQREMQIARDVLKYRDGAIAPVSIATTEPMPSGSPLPVRLSLQTTTADGSALVVTIAATAIDDPAQSVTLDAVLADRVPLPGSQVRAATLAPAPTGAP